MKWYRGKTWRCKDVAKPYPWHNSLLFSPVHNLIYLKEERLILLFVCPLVLKQANKKKNNLAEDFSLVQEKQHCCHIARNLMSFLRGKNTRRSTSYFKKWIITWTVCTSAIQHDPKHSYVLFKWILQAVFRGKYSSETVHSINLFWELQLPSRRKRGRVTIWVKAINFSSRLWGCIKKKKK